ncbi:unnamed protein product [Clonostachys chloroleuca]|uniref:Uncharacterized protein n=1 Tax=Clonostachys chloroleuca TaxID=1926264 RepID=A0AA35VSN0_9HYPO|nr:unnamed protein product [Clonostachys chloroleuca]
MEPTPHEKKDHPSDLAQSAGPTLADSQAMSRKRSHGQANVELTSVPADQSTADAEVDNLGQPAKRPKSNRHSSWMWAGDGPHHGWSPSYVAMTKCDFCSLASRGVVHQCNDCKLTVCGDCVGKGKLEDDEVHHIKPGSLNWEVPKKTKVTATSSSSLPPKPRGGLPPKPRGGGARGRGAKRHGGLANRAPAKDTVSSVGGLAGASENRPSGETAAGPWATSRKGHGEENNHNGAQTTSFPQIEQPPNANFTFRYPYPPPPIPHHGTSLQQNGPAESSHARDGNKRSSHARDGNKRRQYTPIKIESTDISHPRRGAARPVPSPLDLGYLNNSRSAPRGSNDLTAYSRANQNSTSFAEYHQPIESPSRNPGVQLPPIDELFRTVQRQSQPASAPAPKPYLDPIRPQRPHEKPGSPRPSAWGAELVYRALETSKALPNWPLDEEGDLHQQTQSESAAFQAILAATYHAIATLNLNPVKNAARQWVCEQEMKIKDKGVNPFGL